jgi:hypothetical protein
MAATDPHEDDAQETRQDVTANLGDELSADELAARVRTLRHLVKQMRHV